MSSCRDGVCIQLAHQPKNSGRELNLLQWLGGIRLAFRFIRKAAGECAVSIGKNPRGKAMQSLEPIDVDSRWKGMTMTQSRRTNRVLGCFAFTVSLIAGIAISLPASAVSVPLRVFQGTWTKTNLYSPGAIGATGAQGPVGPAGAKGATGASTNRRKYAKFAGRSKVKARAAPRNSANSSSLSNASTCFSNMCDSMNSTGSMVRQWRTKVGALSDFGGERAFTSSRWQPRTA